MWIYLCGENISIDLILYLFVKGFGVRYSDVGIGS